MSRLRPMAAREVLALLARHRFVVVSQRGSHVKLRGPGGRIAIVPVHASRLVKVGTLKRLLRDAGISEDEVR